MDEYEQEKIWRLQRSKKPQDDLDIVNGKKRGRPATGENTKVMRVPKDFDREIGLKMYFEWLPILEEYAQIARDNPLAVRNEKLIKLMEELGLN